VLLSEGEDWRQQRRSVSPAFTPANVERVVPQFVEAAEHLCTRAGGGMVRGSVNLYRLFQTSAIEALGRGLFSLPFGERADRLAGMARQYFAGAGRPNLADSFARQEGQFPMASWRRRRFEKAWFAEIDSILADWREAAALGPAGGSRQDIMTVMSDWRDPDTGRPMSERELRHQTATMIAAGFETTALTMFWAAYLIANNAETQQEIRREIARHAPGELQSMKDLERWPRLREAIFEALRLYPPVSFMSRVAIEPSEICGREIAPGTVIVICPWVLHRHRRFWNHPQWFKPDRFAGQPRAHLSGGAFIPFGSGPRICLGASFAFAEAMILLGTLIERFEITVEARPLVPRAIISTTPSVEPGFQLRPIAR
jgi:cytochrome P450